MGTYESNYYWASRHATKARKIKGKEYKSFVFHDDPLATALANMPRNVPTSPYFKRAECDQPGWEGEWARVQRMRKEKHPLMAGGKGREFTYTYTPAGVRTQGDGEHGVGKSRYYCSN